MIRKHNYDNDTAMPTIRAVKTLAFVAMFAVAVSASVSSTQKTVTLKFIDTAMVNDTLIRVGDIAKIVSDDAALVAIIKEFSIGEAAPAGFSRYINTDDLVIFNIRPQFKNVQFVCDNPKRIKVLSDYQERRVGDFEDDIRKYASERLGWEIGLWELVISNPQHSWKSGVGATAVEISGIDNPFVKGSVNLNITMRLGSRVNRVPVQCRIIVKAQTLVASRLIQRGEEFTKENTITQVTDITNFAFTPLRELPKTGTMTAFRTVCAGNILHEKMLRAIPTVARGDQVRINFVGVRVKVSVSGVARDSGVNGERIWVENLQTGKLIRAAITGKGSVAVHQEGEKS